MDGKILISKDEYLELLVAASALNSLERGGVNNWQWHDDCEFENEEIIRDFVEKMPSWEE